MNVKRTEGFRKKAVNELIKIAAASGSLGAAAAQYELNRRNKA